MESNESEYMEFEVLEKEVIMEKEMKERLKRALIGGFMVGASGRLHPFHDQLVFSL